MDLKHGSYILTVYRGHCFLTLFLCICATMEFFLHSINCVISSFIRSCFPTCPVCSLSSCACVLVKRWLETWCLTPIHGRRIHILWLQCIKYYVWGYDRCDSSIKHCPGPVTVVTPLFVLPLLLLCSSTTHFIPVIKSLHTLRLCKYFCLSSFMNSPFANRLLI